MTPVLAGAGVAVTQAGASWDSVAALGTAIAALVAVAGFVAGLSKTSQLRRDITAFHELTDMEPDEGRRATMTSLTRAAAGQLISRHLTPPALIVLPLVVLTAATYLVASFAFDGRRYLTTTLRRPSWEGFVAAGGFDAITGAVLGAVLAVASTWSILALCNVVAGRAITACRYYLGLSFASPREWQPLRLRPAGWRGRRPNHFSCDVARTALLGSDTKVSLWRRVIFRVRYAFHVASPFIFLWSLAAVIASGRGFAVPDEPTDGERLLFNLLAWTLVTCLMSGRVAFNAVYSFAYIVRRLGPPNHHVRDAGDVVRV